MFEEVTWKGELHNQTKGFGGAGGLSYESY
jgi:hypothetical protein